MTLEQNEVLDKVADALDLESTEAGPKRVQSLLRRRAPLAEPEAQLAMLNTLDLDHTKHKGSFFEAIKANGWSQLQPSEIEIFQINIGKLCNMTCRHCHVDSGPDRTEENMDRAMVDACLHALDQTNAHTVDLTGGAPELNPHFRYLVDECVKRGKHVMDRCNLTILTVPKYQDLPEWFAERGVEVVCSLPHYRKFNTDAQRGEGTYEKSIRALRMLNDAGYGKGDPKRVLTLVANPVGAFLPGNQTALEREWKAALDKNFGLSFDRLIAINNMPISRYLEWLEQSDNLQSYMETLTNAFNPGTVSGLMCRNTLSISWDGRIFDCDFNQMLDMQSQLPNGTKATIQDFDFAQLQQRELLTNRHCFGCTAGAGSSCGGSIDE